jgi:hypothetical protein
MMQRTLESQAPAVKRTGAGLVHQKTLDLPQSRKGRKGTQRIFLIKRFSGWILAYATWLNCHFSTPLRPFATFVALR